MKNMDYGTIAAMIAALAAVYAIWVEGKRARFSQGLDLLQKFSSEFNSEIFKEKRRTVAKILLNKAKGQYKNKDKDELENIGSDIIDHFQAIGLLMRRHILDKELVYSDYYYWLIHYWECLKDIFIESRQEDMTVWEDAEWLHNKIVGMEKKLPPKGVVTILTDVAIKDFLMYESTLQ